MTFHGAQVEEGPAAGPAGPAQPFDDFADARHAEHRLAFVRGLRELAGWLIDHPAAPVPPYGREITSYILDVADDAAGVARVRQIADVLGLPVEATDRHASCVVEFPGGIKWSLTYTYQQAMDEWQEMVADWRQRRTTALLIEHGPGHCPACCAYADQGTDFDHDHGACILAAAAQDDIEPEAGAR